MTGLVRWNKAKTPAGADGWSLTPDIGSALDSANVVVPVATQAERDGLAPPAGKYPGMAVVRMDFDGCPIEIWTGSAWVRQIQSSPLITSDSNWSYGGGLTRTWAQGITHVTASFWMLRKAGVADFTITTSDLVMGNYIPTGWCPAVNSYGWAHLTNAGGNAGQFQVVVTPTGDLIARTTSGSLTVKGAAAPYSQINLSMGWYQ